MKKSARNRIIIWSIVSIILIGMLTAGIAAFSKYSIFNYIGGSDHFENGAYSVGNAAFSAEQVDSVEIDWIAGSVEVVSGDTDKIIIEETSSSNITDEKAMRYSLDGSTLKITAGEDLTVFKLFSFGSYGISKNLTVTVPKNKSLDSLKIDAASADINIDCGAKINKLTAETASGSIEIYGVTGINAEVNATSGDIVIESRFESIDSQNISGQTYITSNCKSLDISSVSGTVNATVGKEISSVDVESVSGTVNLTLPGDTEGFTAKYETVSGRFSSDFEGRSTENSFTSGNGSVRIDVNTVSGNICIK